MAKMKVYELAKEIGVENAEILAILESKGIEGKKHMSALEDDQIEEVRKAVKGAAKSDKAPKAEEKPKTAETPKAEEKPKTAEVPKAEEKPKAAEAPKPAPVKKKKSIIFVSNPDNSRMKGSQVPKNPVRPAEKKVDPAKTVKPAPAAEASKHASELKTQPGAAVESADTVKSASVSETPKAVAAEQPKVERPAMQRTEQRGENRTDNNGVRRDGQRRDGQRENNRDNNGPRRDGGRRDGQRDNNGGRRDGQRRDGQSFGGGRRDGQNFGGGRDNNRGGFGAKGSGKSGGFVPDSPVKEPEKHRDEEKRRISQEKDKRNRKDFMYEDDGDNIKNIKGKNKPGKFIKPEKKPVETVEEKIKVITLPETITIKELAEKMKIQPSAIVKKLFLQGQIVTVNQEVTYETAENIAIEYDIICEQEVKVDVIEELLKESEEDPNAMVARPPVICVMGHVDHGKTSLLDAIRKTNVTDKEAGGITQHIGAYTVNINDQKITFLDTPGHEAFTAMRMRGANSTDIAILVVAADDGVMPQTVEAINHAKAAGIEIIVAVNKIDKPGANIERVKQELTEYELISEDWGGSTIFVPVSAKSGEGIEQLLEMILLTAEVLELKANPNRRARGLVIEAELDKGRGPVATILVQKGTLKVGDFVSAGAASGKVRAMVDDKGRRVKEAGPSTPVEILGLGDVPNAGEIFIAHENDKEAKYYAETFVAQNKEKLLEDTKAKMSLDDLFSQIQAGNLKELNLIIKADVQGSVEAVKQSLVKLSNEEVVVKCIHGGVGAINESDVILASASNAIIIGFNVRPDAQAKATSEREGVDVRLYKVIYQAIEDIEAAMKGMLDPIFEEKVIGHAEVRQIFKASAVGNIAGSYVLDGMFQRNCKIRITREGEQIYEGELASLKRFKDDVKEVKAGFECGLVFEGFDSMQELDIVEAYIMVEVPR
ncbi:MAG: translation initiation factor IF-2 [Lachnospiraceae bacterium]|nr:translation initiation factor IF-2 [Lachnospiraceae bacterium]